MCAADNLGGANENLAVQMPYMPVIAIPRENHAKVCYFRISRVLRLSRFISPPKIPFPDFVPLSVPDLPGLYGLFRAKKKLKFFASHELESLSQFASFAVDLSFLNSQLAEGRPGFSRFFPVFPTFKKLFIFSLCVIQHRAQNCPFL